MKAKLVSVLAATACAVLLAGCGDDKKSEAPSVVKAAFIYPSPVRDEGWSQQHDMSRLAAEAALAGKVKTSYVENVTTIADAERVIRDLASQGNEIIFTTSFEFMNPTLKVAKEFPNVKFEHCTGYKTGKNTSNYNARFYQARYLAGKLAGAMTKANVLGYAAAIPIPEVLQGINAFTLGAQSVNPNVQVRVVWTNCWYDPGKESDATKTLIGQGCDVISHHTNSQAVAATCEAAGVKVISYHAIMKKAAPTQLIGAVTHHWNEFYAKRMREVIEKKWKVAPLWGGAELHMVKLEAVTDAAPKSVRDDIAATYAKMEAKQFNVFMGPVVDNEGKVQITAGAAADDSHLNSMGYFVKGVLGKVPKL